jgi:hypothetical protein
VIAPAPASVPPVSAITWPAVFDGIGALVVRCDLDPAALVDRINRHSHPHLLSWIAPKVNGADITPRADIDHAVSVWRSLGLHVGSWIWNAGPPDADVTAAEAWYSPEFVVYDVESPYKSDEGGRYEWAAQLVDRHEWPEYVPAAVTSYGGYKTSIDFAAFARAGWPILAQVYDSFKPGDQQSYLTANGGVYPRPGAVVHIGDSVSANGVHMLKRSLALLPGEAVYRPEGIDG